MNGLFTLLIIGVLVYMIFSRKGGVGCCGGSHHNRRPSGPPQGDSKNPVNPSVKERHAVIDLGREDYKVISAERTGGI